MTWMNVLAFIGAFVLAIIAGAVLYLLLHETMRSGMQAFRIARHVQRWHANNPASAPEEPLPFARLFLSLWREELFRWSYDVVTLRGRGFYSVPWAERRYFERQAKEMEARLRREADMARQRSTQRGGGAA